MFKDIDVVQLVLQAVLNRNVDLITTEAQKEFYLSVGGKRFVLDSFSVGKDGDLFNVEVQRDNSDAPLIRAFYHHVAIAASPVVSLQKGESCEDAPNVWVIFICEKDPYKKGLPFYSFDFSGKDGLPELENVNTLYVNGEFRDNSPLGWLMHDFNCSNYEDMFFQVLAAIVKYFKTTKGGRRKLKESAKMIFSKYGDEIDKKARAEGREEGRAEGRAEGREEGRKEERAKALRNVMEKCKFSLEQAAAALNIPVDEAEALRAY